MLARIAAELRDSKGVQESSGNELTNCWIGLRLAAAEYAAGLQEQPVLPDFKWTPEPPPPSSEDLDLTEEFIEFLMERSGSLEEALDAIEQGTNTLTSFGLRTALCAYGITKESTCVTEDPAATTFRALTAVLRPLDNSIARARFGKAQQYVTTEKRVNSYLINETGIDLVNVLSMAGDRVKAILSRSQEVSSVQQAEALLIHCSNLLALEPRATCSFLFLEMSGSSLAKLVDMVIRLDCATLNEQMDLILRVWDFCARVVGRCACLGKPKPQKLKQTAGASENLRRNSAAIIGVFANQAPPMGKTMSEAIADAANKKMCYSSPKNYLSDVTNNGCFAMEGKESAANGGAKRLPRLLIKSHAMRSLPDLPSTSNVLSSSRSLPASCRPSSVASSPRTPSSVVKKEIQLPPTSPTSPKRAKKVMIQIPEASVEVLMCKLKSEGRPKSANLEQKRDSLLGNELMKASFTSESADKPWDLTCCLLFWRRVPAQCLVFSLGLDLQTMKNTADMVRFVRGAWSLLDKARAIDCYFGTIGVARLRVQLEALVDSRIFCESETMDVETLNALIAESEQTAVRLATVCRANERFAKVAVLYGAHFFVDRLVRYAQTSCDATTMACAPSHNLLETLAPHVKNFFRPQH